MMIRGSRPLAALLLCLGLAAQPAAAQRRDYLTSLEADNIRDAETSARRIRLFVSYAADRLKKFHYELGKPSTDRRRAERLNSLLSAYTGCIDDAADLVSIGVERQEDIRAGLKDLQARVKEFLPQLEKLAAEGAELESYKDTLTDAIEATKEAAQAAEKAAKEIAPPPVRRKN